ncbi:MAG: glycosyltransferase family 2 protein [Gammaproteobacteria bacterium]|nr:glycosyltransferase family 2 protein [Gammaproteobacteria bacterium]
MSLSTPSISVVIPTHNRSEVLRRALRSIEAQSLPATEIIVVDDGSQDDTAAAVALHHPEVRLLGQRQSGVSSARNNGIRQARGDWLALLDSDDEWLPDKLAVQMHVLAEAPAVRLCHTEEIWIRNGRRVNQKKRHAKRGGRIFRHSLPLCAISPSSVVIHRSLFDEVGLFDESLPACEDYDLWLRICARESVAYVETPQIIKYGGHEDQLSRRHWGMDRFRVRALQKILDEGILDAADYAAASAMLRQKTEILAQGAARRGRSTEAARYRAIAARYARK